MTLAALDRLNGAVDALNHALDSDDIGALERAVASVPPALDALGDPCTLPRTSENHALVKTLAEKFDNARVRIAVLGDLGRRRLDQLALAGIAVGSGATYAR